MKNVLLIIALALFGFRAAAQDYRPFVEEGKTWRIARLTSLNDDPTYPVSHVYFRMKGDTIVAGKTWKIVRRSGVTEPGDPVVYNSYCRYLVREENKRVYFSPYPGREELMYDFNVSVGDTLALHNIYYFDERNTAAEFEKYSPLCDSITIVSEDKITSVGRSYRGLILSRKLDGNECKASWIEGIGGVSDIFFQTIPLGLICGSALVLEECSVGDEILYHDDITGLTMPQVNPIKNTAIYDLSGRRLQAIPQRGVYIVNGKKYIR
ncbi:MAG: hypothetical protein ACFNO3_01840 [Alloprevotella tannerae]|jgi:hypothetical protein